MSSQLLRSDELKTYFHNQDILLSGVLTFGEHFLIKQENIGVLHIHFSFIDLYCLEVHLVKFE